ncbi:hypothetical protein PTTG_08214, partial [Puccinia triticina 1-1 BBBD Race 1]
PAGRPQDRSSGGDLSPLDDRCRLVIGRRSESHRWPVRPVNRPSRGRCADRQGGRSLLGKRGHIL